MAQLNLVINQMINGALCVNSKTIDFKHQPLIEAALELNRKKWLFTPYRAATLIQLPNEEKKKYANLAALTPDSSIDETLKYAAGILIHLTEFGRTDVAGRILSFLPYMNMKKAETYLSFAKEKHPNGLTVEIKTEDENNQSGYECAIRRKC